MSGETKDGKMSNELKDAFEKQTGIKLEEFSGTITVSEALKKGKGELLPEDVKKLPILDKLDPPKEMNTCHMCAKTYDTNDVEKKLMGPLSLCECCNHPFCNDCIEHFNELRDNEWSKHDFKGDLLGFHKNIRQGVRDQRIYCFCNCYKNLQVGLRDQFGKSVHYTGYEMMMYYKLKKAKIDKFEREYQKEGMHMSRAEFRKNRNINNPIVSIKEEKKNFPPPNSGVL